MSIGKTIRSLRIEKKMTQEDLAKKLFVSQDTISLWELDKSLPDIPNLIKLTKIFQVSADEILGLDE